MSNQSIVSNLASKVTAYFMPAAVNPPSEEDVKVVFDILMDNVNKDKQLYTQLCHFFIIIEILRRMHIFLEKKKRTHSLVEVFSIPALTLDFDGVLAAVVDKTLLSVSEDQRCRNLSEQMRNAVLKRAVDSFQDQNKHVMDLLTNCCRRAIFEDVDTLRQDFFASLEPFLAYTHTAGGIAKDSSNEMDMLASLFWQDFKASENDLTLLMHLILRVFHETQLQAIPSEKLDWFKQQVFDARKHNGEDKGFVGHNFFEPLVMNKERLKKTSFEDVLNAIQRDARVDITELINLIGADDKDRVVNLGQATTKQPEMMDVRRGEELRNTHGRSWAGRKLYDYLGVTLQ